MSNIMVSRQLFNAVNTNIIFLVMGFLLFITGFAEASEKKMGDSLNKKEQCIIEIAAFTASGEIDKLKPALNEALDAGLTINEIKEVLVQLYAYAGFPRSLNGIGTFMGVLEERKAKGIKDTKGKEASPLPTDKSSLEFGTENQTKLIGFPVKGPMFDFSPAIDRFLKAHLFGDIFQRDILTWRERELATIAALANIKGVESQLGAHYGISMNNGVTEEDFNSFIKILEKKVSPEVAKNAEDVLKKFLNSRKK